MSYNNQQQPAYGGEKPYDNGQPGQAAGYYGGAPNVPETYNAAQNYNQGPYGGAGGGGDADRSYSQGPPQGQYPPGQYMNQGIAVSSRRCNVTFDPVTSVMTASETSTVQFIVHRPTMLDLVLSDDEVRRLSIMAGVKLPAKKRGVDPTTSDRHAAIVRAALRLFVSSYGVLRVIEALMIFVRTRQLKHALSAIFSRSRDSFKTALCISSYPALHKLLRLHLPQYASLSPLLNHGLLTLLSSSNTTQLNLYALTGLLAYFLGHKPRDASLQNLQAPAASGGAWWLFPLAQAVLLPVAVFKHELFPSTWKKLTLTQAKRYLPQRPAALSATQSWPDPSTTMSLFPLLLSPVPFPSFPLPKGVDQSHYGPLLSVIHHAQPGHTRVMCAVTHPDEVSCLKNWIGTVGDNTQGALGWVAGFNAVTMGIRWRKWRDDPSGSFKAFVIATARYTGFVGMSLSTAWGLLCLFQRVLPNDRLVYARFPLQAAFASLWILLLPPKRRTDLGMYSMRAAILAAWQVVSNGRLPASKRIQKWVQPLPLTLVMWFLMRRRKIAFARAEDEQSKQLKDASYIGRLVSWVDAAAPS